MGNTEARIHRPVLIILIAGMVVNTAQKVPIIRTLLMLQL